MKRFEFKKFLALMLSVAMLLTGIPYSGITAYADETAAPAVQEVILPDGKVGTLSGTAEMIPANIRLEDDDTDLIFAEEQPEEGVKLVLSTEKGLVKDEANRGKVRDRIRNFNDGAGVEIGNDTLFFLEYEASEDFDLTKLTLEGTTAAAEWTTGFTFSRQSNENGTAVYAVSANGEDTLLNDIRLKGSAGKFPEGSSITLKKAYFVSDIREASEPEPIDEPSEGIKVGDERIVGKKKGTVVAFSEANTENYYKESGSFNLADPQPADGVKFVYATDSNIRNRIKNFSETGVEVSDKIVFVLEYDSTGDFSFGKLTVQGTSSAGGWDDGFALSLISDANGVAMFSVAVSAASEPVLFDVRFKGNQGAFSEGATVTLKNAYFLTDVEEVKDPEPEAGPVVGAERIAGRIKGKVVAFSEANTENYYMESGSFNLAASQPEEGVKFVYSTDSNVRNRIKNFSETGVEISDDIAFVLEYDSTGDFSFGKLTVQGTSSAGGWDDGFGLTLISDEDGVAMFSVAVSAAETPVLFDVRFKGNQGIFADGTTLTLKNAYFLTDVQILEDLPPAIIEGFVVGAKKTVGRIEGTISGIVKADGVNMIMEADEPDMNPAAEQPEEGVKFEKSGDGGKVRNRFFVNERAGAAIAEGDKFVIEFEASEDFDLTQIALFPQNTSATSYEDTPELTLDGDIVNGVAIYSVPASYKDGVIYAIRLKSSAGIPRGAWVIFKDVYFLTDVKNASTEIDPNENPVGKEYVVGDLSGKISGYVKLDKSNVQTESGRNLVASAEQPETGIKLEMNYNTSGDGKVRNRFYINEKTGVTLKKGDRFIIDREIIGGLELENIDFEPQFTGPDAYDDPTYGKLEYLDTIDNKAIYKVPDTLDGITIYAIRGKAEKEFISDGSAIIIKGMYFLTDVIDNSEPEKPACPYEISEIVQGITVTYYNDVFSRGVAWRTINNEASDSVLQIINRDDVEDISTFWWNTEKVVTIPDNFGVSYVNDTKDAAVYTCHKAHVENLPDGTVYYYRVGSEISGWSKPGIMKIDSEFDDFTFIHVTDPQATSESEYRQFENVLRAAYKKVAETGSTHVGTINTGDITNECHDGKVFIDEYNMSQDYDADDLMNSVLIPVAGNHDVTEDLFWSMYEIDFQDYCEDGKHNTHRTGGCYSYQVGNVFILGTNSNESGNLSYSPANGEYDSKADYHEQYNWIKDQLEWANELRAEGKIKWIVYLTHAGMMSVGYHTMDGGSRCLRENITPLLAEYEVDLVLQGHDHAYTRTVPYYYGTDLNGKQFSGYQSNERETFKGYGDVSCDDPYTAEIETEGRIWNVEPEGTHYITINYSGTKSLEISKDNAEARYQMPDQCILDGIAVSPVNGTECGLKYAKQFYALVRVSGDVMTYDTYCFSGGKSELFDTFTVIKDGNHNPDLEKQDVDFIGVYVEDKEYDGKAARLELDDILAVKPGTEEEEIQFTDYDKIVFTVTGSTANSGAYYSKKLPKQIGIYTLHITVSDASAFFKGETTIDFSITAGSGSGSGSGKNYIGGLTADLLGGGGSIEFTDDDEEPGTPAPGGSGTIPIIIPVDPEEPSEPTGTPSEPTGTPAEPTGAPSEPTGAPAEPTGAPAEPTGTPSEPTGAPAEPTGEPGETVDIGGDQTPEGAVEDEAEEVTAEYFKKDKEFTGKKLTGFDVNVESSEDEEYPKTVKVKVDGNSIGEAGKTLYLYKADKDSKKLLETAETKITVDSDGYAEFTAYEEGEFVLLSKKASKKTVVSLGDQISAKSKLTIKAGKTKKNASGLVLPAELKDAKVVYSTNNKKIVKVDKKTGKITAVKKGKAKITAKITLPDGTVKKIVTTITVK